MMRAAAAFVFGRVMFTPMVDLLAISPSVAFLSWLARSTTVFGATPRSDP